MARGIVSTRFLQLQAVRRVVRSRTRLYNPGVCSQDIHPQTFFLSSAVFHRMTLALGIDTGGTYTAAVLVRLPHGQILAGAKAQTTHHDLAIGIRHALTALFHKAKGIDPGQIGQVSLSTTLATNAIVEGRTGKICLLLLGYDPELIDRFDLRAELVSDDVVFLAGGHNGLGDEVMPLDEDGLVKAVRRRLHEVDAFAVSSYFSIRNPEHELRARALIEEVSRQELGAPLPVTCGHELTSRLNAIRRATTTALNAGLIPLLTELVDNVRVVMAEHDIHAPLMVVKGDGSLVRAAWAMQRPIETILSGPAASVVGAGHLVGRKDVWVVDMGGTTTDIAGLNDGRPRLNAAGAQVGRWRTMVEAVDVYTTGLGGDSEVYLDTSAARGQRLQIGPRRVIPLCMLAQEHPDVLAELEEQSAYPDDYRAAGRFVVLVREPRSRVSDTEQLILDALAAGPRPLDDLLALRHLPHLVRSRLMALRRRRVVVESAFTPTDALHVLGRLNLWDARAAWLGAAILARRLGVGVQELCEQVVEGVSARVAQALVGKALLDEGVVAQWEREPTAQALLERGLHETDSGLRCALMLDRPIVGIGAPAQAYLPRTATLLHSDLLVPDHAEVANAIGAVVGSVVQQRVVEIHPLEADHAACRVHLPDGVADFSRLEAAVRHAERVMCPYLEDLARQAGAEQVEVKMKREDLMAPVQEGWGDELWLETRLIFTAVGRPGWRAESEEEAVG
ncbi:MAG: hydantoinase/oxoprolinase family protein [Caldilineae bacterium]|nr:MAG: hydantoinase/oxoprolinase family protein [Caldilineae bacterium]